MGSSAATTIGFGAPISIPAGFGAAGPSAPSTAAPSLAGEIHFLLLCLREVSVSLSFLPCATSILW